jgi:hypothetical protein
MATFAGQYGPEALISVTSGAPLIGQSVTVNVAGGGAATIYTSRTKGATATNPVVADSYGNLTFWADPGRYDLVFAGRTITVEVVPDYAEAPPSNPVWVTGPRVDPLDAVPASTVTLSTTYYIRFRSQGNETLPGLNLLAASGTTPAAIVALYANGSNAPTTRLATSVSTALTVAGVATNVPFTTGFVLAPQTDYWLAVAVTGTTVTALAQTLTAALAAVLVNNIKQEATATPPATATPATVSTTAVVPQVWAVL